MPYSIGSTVIRPENPPNRATILSIRGMTAHIQYEEGGDGWWPLDALEEAIEDLTPRWVQFGVALGAIPEINALVTQVMTVAPVLHLMLGVGLGQAAQGEPKTFLAAWNQAVASGLVSENLAASVAAMASSFDLPAAFIAALTDTRSNL